MNTRLQAALDAPKFNWWEALDACIEEPGSVSFEQQIDLEDKASQWPTCACGQLCQALPRFPDGSPKDESSKQDGHTFYHEVCDANWRAAKSTMQQIEARTTELLEG